MSDNSEEQQARDQFAEAAAISGAEAAVSMVRLRQLEDAQIAARRRISAAKGRLTKAQRDGSAAKIADARAHLEHTRAEFDRISRAVIDEAKAIFDARHEAHQELRDLMDRFNRPAGPTDPRR